VQKLIVRFSVAAVTVATVGGTPLVGSGRAGAAEVGATARREFVVVYAQGVSTEQAHQAIASAGGAIVSENTDIGVATVTTADTRFEAAADAQPAIEGAARNRVIGAVPRAASAKDRARKFDEVEVEAEGRTSPPRGKPAGDRDRGPRPPRSEPLADRQWDMRQIGATVDGSYRYEQGRGVKVGIIDTGVDASHPDIAPNFDARLSRNFTVDLPVDANGDPVDGPCEEEPDKSCNDPADVDEDGHGTHVASTIASPVNGLGMAGVAPQATIVNLRAGQDSGFFFLQPSVDALTYAGRNGVDVVNMSYYVDPWLFNCANHPADSPEEQTEQRTIVTAMQRALDYAHARGVTLVSAAGNGNTDYTKVLSDASSPDIASEPGEAPKVRDLLDPASCISMPSEGNHVISVSSTSRSLRKAYYSDFGNGYVDVAAPGGDVYDTPTGDRDYAEGVLAAYPASLAIANGEVDAGGEPTVPYVVRNCDARGTCAYYQYLQGTSMASPHATGVAALVVGQRGSRDRRGELSLDPDVVERVMKSTATDTPCPTPPAVAYTRRVPQPDGSVIVRTSSATCEGTPTANGFYGEGVISALRAVGGRSGR
jgi:subtilisin family serine protease